MTNELSNKEVSALSSQVARVFKKLEVEKSFAEIKNPYRRRLAKIRASLGF